MLKSYTNRFHNRNIKTKTYDLIDLGDVKRHLRIDEMDEYAEDTYLTSLLQVGVDFAENYCNADIAYTENLLTVYDFIGDRLQIDEGNLIYFSGITGTSVTYQVFDNLIDFTIYFDEAFASYGRVFIDAPLHGTDLMLKYSSGFTKDTLPSTIRQAILIKIADLFDVQRNSFTTSTFRANDVIDILLGYYKKW